MAESQEMIAAVLTSALLRNSGTKETKLAVEKYLLCLELLQSMKPAHAAPAPAPAPVAAPPETHDEAAAAE
jgi:hypothetical protein